MSNQKTIRPFGDQNGYTTFSNYILDYIMPNLSPNGWKVLCFIIRKTEGWNKDSDQLSFSQIMDGTGIANRTTVRNAIKELRDNNYVNIIRGDRVTSNTYSLNTDFEIVLGSTGTVPPKSPGSTEIGPEGSTETVPQVVQKSDSQNKDSKTSFKDSPKGDGKKQPSPRGSPKKPVSDKKKASQEMFSALTKVCKVDLRLISDESRGKFNQAEKIFRNQGCTPEQVYEFEQWWLENDWRGQRGQPPTLSNIRETWGQFLAGVKTTRNGVHHEANRSNHSSRFATGEALDQQPTYDPYTNEIVGPDGTRKPARGP